MESEAKLGELLEIKHGFAFKGKFFSDVPTADVLLTPGNFAIGGGFKFDKLKYYDGPVPDDYVLHQGDLIVTMTDLSKSADTLGYPALVPDSKSSCRYLHNQRLGLVTVKNTEVLDPNYLYYLMCSRSYRNHVLAGATGTTVKHTSPTKICNFSATIPPLAIQRRIANILGTLDDKIELNRRMNQTLEKMAAALFKSWFIDFDPVHAKAEGRDPNLPADIANLFPDTFQDSELGPIPEGREIKSLDQIADFLNGLACQKYPAVAGEPSLPVIKIRELRQGVSNNTDRAAADVPAKYLVNDGDVLFSWSGSLLVRIWCHGPGVLNQHVFKVTSKGVPPWFSYHATKHFLDEFQRIAADKATTMGHIKRRHLTEAQLAVPDSRLLGRSAAVLGALFQRRTEALTESRRLAVLRDTLLPELVSGETDLTELLYEAREATA